MNTNLEIVPTVVPKDAEEFAKAVSIARRFTNRIHLDIDDGVFAPVPTWPYLPNGEFMPFNLGSVGVKVEAHLMVKDPRSAGDVLAGSGAALVVGHIEAFSNPDEAKEAIASWRSLGAQAGISILMNTPLDVLEPIIDMCDIVQVMSIDVIGAQGAAFDPRAVARIGQIHAKHPGACIAADGGISSANIADLARIGVKRFLVGTAIMKQPDPAYAYQTLKEEIEKALHG